MLDTLRLRLAHFYADSLHFRVRSRHLHSHQSSRIRQMGGPDSTGDTFEYLTMDLRRMYHSILCVTDLPMGSRRQGHAARWGCKELP